VMVGDSDFAKVPRGLVDKKYAKELAGRINKNHVTRVKHHGQPPCADDDLFGKHTTHIAAADAEGNWVAITATVNTAFGSKIRLGAEVRAPIVSFRAGFHQGYPALGLSLGFPVLSLDYAF